MIDASWSQLAPEVDLGAVDRVDGYEVAIQTAKDAETAVDEALAQVTNKRAARDTAITALNAQTRLVVNGVIGNPAYGPDSDLYEAMGFVPTHKRKSGLTQRTTPPPTP